jgi:protein gp37
MADSIFNFTSCGTTTGFGSIRAKNYSAPVDLSPNFSQSINHTKAIVINADKVNGIFKPYASATIQDQLFQVLSLVERKERHFLENTKINWAKNTFNPWQGCTNCSDGCDHCYAETQDNRMLHDTVTHWGKGVERRTMSEQYWKNPLAWNRKAERDSIRPRVFCASTADWADSEAPAGQRERLWETIRATPNLDWLLLTKRPKNIRKYLPRDWGEGYPNVWLGVSVENKKQGLPRIDVLRGIPAVIRFLSIEPLLEDLGALDLNQIHWAIIGGETGPGARSLDTAWIKSILRQCKEQKVAAWVKQLGRVPEENGIKLRILKEDGKRDYKGEDTSLWPPHLNKLVVRKLPKPVR